MPKSTKSRRAQTARTVPSTETNRANLTTEPEPMTDLEAAIDEDANRDANNLAIEPDQDGLEPEQVQQYGEEDVPESTEYDDPTGGIGADDLPRDTQGDEPEDDYLEIEVSPGNSCACGCRQPVTTSDRVTRYFRQGHDQRLIGILAQTAAQGREVGRLENGSLVIGSAQQYGAKFLTSVGAAKLDRAIQRATEKATAQAARKAAKATKAAPTCKHGNLAAFPCSQCAAEAPAATGPQTGDEVKVRIGRHTYYARVHGMNQAGKVTAVAYSTKAQPDVEKITERFTFVD